MYLIYIVLLQRLWNVLESDINGGGGIFFKEIKDGHEKRIG